MRDGGRGVRVLQSDKQKIMEGEGCWSSNRSKWEVVKVMAAAIGDYKMLLNLTFFLSTVMNSQKIQAI